MPADRPDTSDHPLQAFLLGTLDLDAALALQRRLAFEVAGGGCPAVVVCDHPPGISVGREGSRNHVRPPPEALAARGWPVRWVARGGGCLLHLPGQVACYPVVRLTDLGLSPARYIDLLNRVVVELLAGFGVTGVCSPGEPGVRVGNRRVAHVGVAVRDGVTTFGVVVNVTPDLEPFRDVRCDGDPAPMTSLLRESPARARVPAVRQRLVELVAEWCGFGRVSVFHTHPNFLPKPARHAIAPRTR